jgi:hypothetical protein
MRFVQLLQVLLIAAALLFMDTITLVRVDTCPNEQLPSLIGFPLPYRTSIPWVNSMSGALYAQGLLLDLLFWALAVAAIGWGLARAVPKALSTSNLAKVFSWSVAGISALVILFFFTAIEWHWQWSPDLPFQCTEGTLQFMKAFE